MFLLTLEDANSVVPRALATLRSANEHWNIGTLASLHGAAESCSELSVPTPRINEDEILKRKSDIQT